MVDFVTPFRDRTLELLEDHDELDKILAAGAERAAAVAERTLARRLRPRRLHPAGTLAAPR